MIFGTFPFFLCLLSSYMTRFSRGCVRVCVGIRSKMALCFPALLALCAVGYVHIRPSTNTSFSHYRCHQSSPIDYFLTSLSTDLVPRGNLRAGAGDFRKPSKGPEAVLGVDGKMHSAWIYESSLNKKLSRRQRFSDRARPDRRKSLRRSANLWRAEISANLNHRYFPMTAVSIITSVFIMYWILKLPVWFFLFLVFLCAAGAECIISHDAFPPIYRSSLETLQMGCHEALHCLVWNDPIWTIFLFMLARFRKQNK